MRIPRPRERERPPFGRSRAPPAQATKLLITSMSAGLILIVALAIVFIPRALQQEGKPPIPIIGLQISGSGASRSAVVTEATLAAPLADYNATVFRYTGYSNTTVGALAALADGASDGALTFHDDAGPGSLSAGDSFAVSVQPGSTYKLLIWYKPLEKLVGIGEWTA